MKPNKKKPLNLIDKVERFCAGEKLFHLRNGKELWALSHVRKPAGKQKVIHLFIEQPSGVLRIESVANKKVPASKQAAFSRLIRTANPFDSGALAISGSGRVSHTLTVPMKPGQATKGRLEELYLDIMVSLDKGMNLISEWPNTSG